MQRSILLLASILCALVFFSGLAHADKIYLKGESPMLGGVLGKIVSGAKPGKKPGEVIRTADEVEITIIINKMLRIKMNHI